MDTTQVTFTNVYNDVKETLSGMGAAMKVGAEHVYEVLVKQQAIKAGIYLFFDIFFLILALICFYVFNKYYKKEGSAAWDSGSCTYFVFGCIFSIITIIIIICNTGFIIMGFFNPEYGAMKDLAKFIQ